MTVDSISQDGASAEIYTKDQQEYVDSVKDEDLRKHLLHQVRLRDNMERDRNSFEQMLTTQVWGNIVINAKEMRKDKSEGSYYYSWQANIAMAFFDQFMNDHEGALTTRQLHEVSNKAAKRFLDQLLIK
jgi:N-acyl-D-aspartate/D-glutamate deacylase